MLVPIHQIYPNEMVTIFPLSLQIVGFFLKLCVWLLNQVWIRHDYSRAGIIVVFAWNTSLAAKGALAYCLQCHTAFKIQYGRYPSLNSLERRTLVPKKTCCQIACPKPLLKTIWNSVQVSKLVSHDMNSHEINFRIKSLKQWLRFFPKVRYFTRKAKIRSYSEQIS